MTREQRIVDVLMVLHNHHITGTPQQIRRFASLLVDTAWPEGQPASHTYRRCDGCHRAPHQCSCADDLLLERLTADLDHTVEQLRSTSMAKVLVADRHELMARLADAGWTLKKIGRLLNRHHTSVLHAVRKVADRRGGVAA